MAAQSFTTEFGHTIPFVPGYFQRNHQYTHFAKASPLHTPSKKEGDQPSIHQPLKNWVCFSAMIDFMRRYGLLRRFGSGVDLGGGMGTCARLFKAAGIIEHATNVDFEDYSHLTSDKFFRFVLKMLRHVESQDAAFQKRVQRAKEAQDLYPHRSIADGLVFDLPNDPTLDANHLLDLLQTPGTYDLVTSFYCLDYFDLDTILAKIRGLLNPGGIFAGLLEYWWWPINSTGILGHFPYAGARLSLNDLKRYYAEHHPDLMDNVDVKYNYFHQGRQHPTINDWFDLARKHGLRPLAVERIVPHRHHRVADCPPQIFASPWFDEREVLRDIHHLKPDVTAEDLFTASFKIALTPA